MRDYNGHELISPSLPLFSLFFVHRSVDFSLLFLLFPLCVPITRFAIFLSIVESMLLLQIDATRYRIPNAFLSCLFFSIFLFLSLYLFIAYRKLSSALSPRGRRKIDLEKVANETQHGIGLRRTNSSRKRFLSLYPLLFPFLLPFPLLARRETKGSFLPRH